MSIRTVQGWLSLLAATVLLGGPGEDTRALVAACPLAVGILDLEGRTLLAVSARLADLLGLADPPPVPIGMDAISDRPDAMGQLFDLLRAGAVDVYAAPRSLRRPDGGLVVTDNWVVVADPEQRRQALWVMVPAGEESTPWGPGRTRYEWPQSVQGLVVGSFDPALRISRVSVDVHAVLGHATDRLVGRPLTDLVHPEDLPALVATMGASLTDQAGAGTQLRLRRSDGEWVLTRWIVTPVMDETLRFGFAFTTSRSDESGEDADASTRRVAALERRLWRIAQEVQAAGVVSGVASVPAPGQVPGLGDLSPRQWEVLTRLLRGERVPAIARDLYLSQSTVRNHLADTFRKLGVNSQQQLLDLFRAAPPPPGT